jgi:hypothetical protein
MLFGNQSDHPLGCRAHAQLATFPSRHGLACDTHGFSKLFLRPAESASKPP